MNAYTMATQLLGDVDLSAGQLAQLRAIDMKYQQRLFTLLHRDDAGRPADLPGAAPAREREPTAEEMAALREMIAADLLDMLTPEQREALRGP